MHEREAVSDFLVTYLKDLVATTRPDLRLVIMSATMQAYSYQLLDFRKSCGKINIYL